MVIKHYSWGEKRKHDYAGREGWEGAAWSLLSVRAPETEREDVVIGRGSVSLFLKLAQCVIVKLRSRFQVRSRSGPRSGPKGPRTKDQRPGPGLTLNLVCHPLTTTQQTFLWGINHYAQGHSHRIFVKKWCRGVEYGKLSPCHPWTRIHCPPNLTVPVFGVIHNGSF